MRFGKIIDGVLIYASNPIVENGVAIGNPKNELYITRGFLPIIEKSSPRTDERHYAVSHWAEQNGQIVQSWTIEEIPYDDTTDKAEAYDILIGGAE